MYSRKFGPPRLTRMTAILILAVIFFFFTFFFAPKNKPRTTKSIVCFRQRPFFLNPFRAPELLPTLNPSTFVPKNGFPVVKGLTLWNAGEGGWLKLNQKANLFYILYKTETSAITGQRYYGRQTSGAYFSSIQKSSISVATLDSQSNNR